MVSFTERRKEYIEKLKGLRLIDDDFMSKVFEDKNCVELLLGIIMQKRDLKVLEVHVQHDINNLQGRSIRLDILAVDSAGQVYDIEIQRSNEGADRKRARYNCSLLDANVTDPGGKYKNLAETYVIFITEHDVLGGNLPIYHIERTVKELENSPFNDGSHIIYVNSEIKDETSLGKLMHDFYCTEAKDFEHKVLADRVKYFKEDPKGVEIMCATMEEIRQEGKQEGRQEGRREGRQEGRREGRQEGLTEATAKLVNRYATLHNCSFDDACAVLGVSGKEMESAKDYFSKIQPL